MLDLQDLNELRDRSVAYARDFLRERTLTQDAQLLAVFLYGGAAKYHFGISSSFDDFDLNLVFQMQERDYRRGHVSTHGMPKDLPPYKGKIIQVMRNVYERNAADAETAIRDIARRGHSKRWTTIRATRLLLLYPEIREIHV